MYIIIKNNNFEIFSYTFVMSTHHERRTTDQLCADVAIAKKERDLMKAAQEMVSGAKRDDLEEARCNCQACYSILLHTRSFKR